MQGILLEGSCIYIFMNGMRMDKMMLNRAQLPGRRFGHADIHFGITLP